MLLQEDNVLNKFRIWKERHIYSDERKPYQSPGRMKNSSYYIAPVGDRTHDLPHTVASNMVKVSHALHHGGGFSHGGGYTIFLEGLSIVDIYKPIFPAKKNQTTLCASKTHFQCLSIGIGGHMPVHLKANDIGPVHHHNAN